VKGFPLEGWQRAVQSIAGPVLPTLAGLTLFAWWRSRWGERIRSRRAFADFFCSVGVVLLLFGYLGVSIPMAGLAADSDYSGFVNHVPLAPWQAKCALILPALVTAYPLYRVIRHVVARYRAWMG
jgi:hypothetical protein